MTFITALAGVVLALVIAGGAFGWSTNVLVNRIGGALSNVLPFDDPFFLPLWIVAVFFVIALHELGHVIAAKAQGFRLITYAVWPLALQRRRDSWRLRRARGFRIGGFVAVDPVTAANVRHRTIVMAAGGPIASLVTALLAIPAAFLAGSRLPYWLHDELQMLGLFAAAIFLIGLIPARGKLVLNDAARIRMLWKPGPPSDRFCALMALAGASRAGIRPRDYNPELVATLPGPDDGTPDWISASLIRYNVLADSNRFEEAGAVLHGVLEHDLHPQIRDLLLLQAAWFEARFSRDLAAARKWMPAKLSSHREAGYRNTLLRAQAAIAFLEGRLDDAEKLARESLEQGNRIEDLGAALLIRERTEELLFEINEARTSESAFDQ